MHTAKNVSFTSAVLVWHISHYLGLSWRSFLPGVQDPVILPHFPFLVWVLTKIKVWALGFPKGVSLRQEDDRPVSTCMAMIAGMF